ncbi:unnamed protein product [Diabrotica balteata]|uniref:Elongation of very long chain fatty acids protein n=1 Tax=Diabrotica balteata TaxID=107213 RepID=A0A9N9X6S6_DIABA|nr:unnamed protein product [Diabrotica balteata]
MENSTNIFDELHKVINVQEDSRTKDFFLVASPIPTIALSVAFLISVTVLIPTFMKNRKPYELKNFVILYNGFQVLFSTWLFYAFLAGGWYFPYFTGKCFLPGSGSNMVLAAYCYFLSKFTEFVDTILFALRKKDNQITRLHLYHHGIMPFGSWLAAKYAPDGPMTFLGLINSLVHVVMYSYYMLSAMGPKVQKYLWWKKYITMMQLIQFILTLTQSLLTFFYGCNLPTAISIFNITQSVVFFVMFFDFYMQSYKKKSSSKLAPNGVAKTVPVKELKSQ